MNANYMRLDKILDLSKWQTLQDSLANATKLAIITVDYKGVPITTHSDCRPFCTAVRSNPNLEKHCQKCDSRGGLEAVRMNAPYIYLCHCNIIDIAIPVIMNDQYIGAIMAGQVKLKDHGVSPLEQIFAPAEKELKQSLSTAQMQALYAAIPHLAYTEIKKSAQMLFDLCHYLVEEAMNKHLLIEMYEKIPPASAKIAPNELSSGYTLNNLAHIKKELTNVLTNTYLKTTAMDEIFCQNPLLKPAFDYIFKHKGENIAQKKIAGLCHLSTSYFSRLFAKETGENFSAFIARQKIEWSKQLLEQTDLPITQISNELGFSDPGYYIKTFKKYEQLTPALYRKYYHEKTR